MDENERKALEEARNERLNDALASDQGQFPSRMMSAISQSVVGAIIVVAAILLWFAATDPCFTFKTRVALEYQEPAAITTKCQQRESGCQCQTVRGECESGIVCSFSEDRPDPSCGMLLVECPF